MVDGFEFKGSYTVSDLVDIIAILRAPGGCPWDREQTHESIKKNFIEETYEVVEAINKKSIPLLREGYSKKKAFFYGQLSGIVEPISGVFGALLVLFVQRLLPFLLSFAAGAMIYVVVEELVPKMSVGETTNIGIFMFAIGFSLMMILDVALG